MAKKRKTKQKKTKVALSPEAVEARRRRLKFALGCVISICCIVGVVVGMKALESKVLDMPQDYPTNVRIRLVDVPSWMPASLAGTIAMSVSDPKADFYDLSLIADVRDKAIANPWVEAVRRVSRHSTDSPIVGIVELDAEYRMPVAVVPLPGGGRAYVDAQGIRLPDDASCGRPPIYAVTMPAERGQPPRAVFYCDLSEVPPNAPVERRHYIEIHGVQSPPPAPGERWMGQDISDAIRLVDLVRTRNYCTQIAIVDVSNHGGRNPRQPHIRMFTQGDEASRTEIRFGRFFLPEGDHVVPVGRRMANLDLYVVTHGRLNYNRCIDLRYEPPKLAN